eukprot:1352173-Pyramimonas_sp.AAC.2
MPQSAMRGTARAASFMCSARNSSAHPALGVCASKATSATRPPAPAPGGAAPPAPGGAATAM